MGDLEMGDLETGEIQYSRKYHRLGLGSRPAQFRQTLIVHAGCWRPAVDVMVRQWPQYFR
jgi:hypothetical protein